jgi:hypothetical protein
MLLYEALSYLLLMYGAFSRSYARVFYGLLTLRGIVEVKADARATHRSSISYSALKAALTLSGTLLRLSRHTPLLRLR